MPCGSCGRDNRGGAVFCDGCGAHLTPSCPECGRELRPDAHFCDACGAQTQVSAVGDRGAETTRREHPKAAPWHLKPDPRSYTPKHLADKILTSRAALEGERKQVTVLFVDVKGSMELAEQVDPEEWHRILDRFFQILTDGVHRFEGTVNQYTGDGIMALFGAPIAHEDHAQRACYAALHLRDELKRYADDLRLGHGLSFSVRMGLNSGEVVVGKIGDDLRMDYTAQGHVVGLAQRMEQLAAADRVSLTEHTTKLVTGYFALRDVGLATVRGVQEPLRVYELQGVGQLHTRFDISRSRGFSRFVGRAEEMQMLEAALARAQAGHAQIVGIVGEAGLGKSRLSYEFLEGCRARGLMTYEAHGVAHGKAVPLLPILQLCRAFYGITEHDSDATARERIAGRLLLLDDAFRDSLPLVFDFLGVPDPERPVPRIDPEARQRQLFAVFGGVIQARGQRETSVTLLEDLHWFDGGSEAFLEPLLDAQSGTRGLVLLTFRPEYHADWTHKSAYQQLALQPLGPEALRQLLVDLLGTDPSLTGLAAAIHARTAGNPFFSEEVVQALIESGTLVGTRGSYRLVAPIEKLEVPGTVHAVLAARIDRLGEREKHVLQTAAVIGKEFSEPVLRRVLFPPFEKGGQGGICDASDTAVRAQIPHNPPLVKGQGDLASALHALKSAEFLYEQALYPVAEYVFKHPLTQEVAYASQLQDRRAPVHAAVARALEAANPAKLDEQAALLAHHWEAAGEALTAAGWHRRAAAWAGRSDPTQGMRHMRRVLALTDGLDASDERSALRLDACHSLLNQGGWRVGLSSEEAEKLFAEGRELATRSADADKAIGLHVGYAAVLGFGGDVRRYHEICREAFDLIDASVSPGPTANLLASMSYSSFCLGRIRDALEFAERIPSVVKGDPNAGIETAGYSALDWSFFFRARLRAHLGCLDDARVLQREAIRRARSRDPSDVLVWSLAATALISDYSGDSAASPLAQEARRYALEAVDLAERMGSHFSRVYAYQWLGLAHMLHSNWPAAAEALEVALALARQHRTGLESESDILANLSRAYLGTDDVARARAAAEQAIERAGAQGARYFECLGWLALARAHHAEQSAAPGGEIAQCLDRALELVNEIEAHVVEPQIIEERARLAQRRGDDVTATAERQRAHALYVAIGATGHAERISRQLSARGAMRND